MGKLDAALGRVANTLVRFGGRPATLIKAGTGGGYNPRTLKVEAPGSVTEYPCEVVLSDYLDSQVDGTLIKRGDRRAIISRVRVGVTPAPDSWTLVEGGRTWQILDVRGYSSGEQEAAFELQLRK